MRQHMIRQQLLVVRDVQISLSLRAVLYGAACMLYFTVVQFFTQSMNHPDFQLSSIFLTLTDEAIYWIPGLLVLAPLMVYDMLRITNRVVGPIFSLRRQMRALTVGEDAIPIQFRNDDYWDTLASEFNALRNHILGIRDENGQLRSALAEIQERQTNGGWDQGDDQRHGEDEVVGYRQ